MAVRNYYGVKGRLTQNINSASIIIPVSSELVGAVSSTFQNNVDTTYFAIKTGNFYELVKILSVVANTFIVERGQGGTTALAFPIGSDVEFEVTSEAIVEQIGTISTDVTIVGQGLAQVTEGTPNNFSVNVLPPNFTGDGKINVLGAWPDITFTYTSNDNDCCGDESSSGGDGITTITGEGLVIAFVNGQEAIIRVPPPVFTSGAGINIVGAWPNYTISATAGSGTVSSVAAGAGITITGSPTVNPTVSITNTGVVAGTYGGIAINSRGQITAVPPTLNPISIINAGAGLAYTRVGDAVTLTPVLSNIGVRGIVALADETDPFDPNDNINAATPAVVAAALEALVTANATGANSYTGEVDADYTNIISGSSVAINIAAGEKALVSAETVVVDGTTPLTPVPYGLAVFSAAPAKIKSNRKVTQNIQNMQFVLDGPLNTSLAIATTALPAGATVTSYSLNVVTF